MPKSTATSNSIIDLMYSATNWANVIDTVRPWATRYERSNATRKAASFQ